MDFINIIISLMAYIRNHWLDDCFVPNICKYREEAFYSTKFYQPAVFILLC